MQNPSLSDKDISFLIQQKLKAINKNEDKNKSQNKSKTIENKTIDNSCKPLREEEEELKDLLNPLYLKDLNIQNNTITNILNNTNNTNLFSSIFQESLPNQTKTFIGIPKNNSLKIENNLNINNNSRPKSSLFQYLGNDIEKYMLIRGEKPINVINYIAQKLVASSFCGSFNFQSFNNSSVNNANNNINQTISFLKNNSESNNSLRKSNGNGENKIENSFENNSLSKDTSLFINDDNNNNDDKDLNFKNLVSILNKKFKSYLSKEKLNKTEISNKNNVIKKAIKISDKNVIINIDNNKSINNIKKDENKNNLFNSFTSQINNKNNINTNNNQNNNNNSYILFSYSKNSKNNKIKQTSLKYKNSIKDKNKKYQNDIKESSTSLSSSKINLYNFNNIRSHYNTFLDISTNYDPGIDSRNSSVERSLSIKKNEIRNFSCSPSHNKKNEKNNNSINKIQNDNNKKNTNYINNRVMNLTKGNNNFNIISEDEEYKEIDKKKINSKSKKMKKYQICQNKVTINLSTSGEDSNNNHKTKSNKKNNSKIKTRIIKNK